MLRNISNIRNCYGCGVCAVSCPKHIIEIHLNNSGFYEPTIDRIDQCIECGICLDVCSYNNSGLANSSLELIGCYAAWSNNGATRQSCSSGGVGYELANHLFDMGYKGVLVMYDNVSNRASHYIADSKDKLNASIGSKYIQSYTVDAFKEINKNEKYLITGTPCQIDSFRRWTKRFKCEENFVMMDFFCHGVPSMHLWNKYSEKVRKITGDFISVSWRNKTHGWHDSWDIHIDGNNKNKEGDGWHKSYRLLIRGKKSKLESRLSNGDLFFKMFLSNSCLGRQCYEHCKFKGAHSSADIRIGDLWGNTYKDNEEGVSGVLTLTARGDELLHQLNCQLTEHSYDVVVEGQLKKKLKKPLFQPLICWLLKTNLPLRFTFFFVQFTRLPYLIKCRLRK